MDVKIYLGLGQFEMKELKQFCSNVFLKELEEITKWPIIFFILPSVSVISINPNIIANQCSISKLITITLLVLEQIYWEHKQHGYFKKKERKYMQ